MKLYDTVKLVKQHWALIPLFVLLVAYSNAFLDPTQSIKYFLLSAFCFVSNSILIKSLSKFDHSFFNSNFIKISILYLVVILFSFFYSNDNCAAGYDVLKAILFFNFLLLGTYYLQNRKWEILIPLSYLFTLFQLIIVLGMLIILVTNDVKLIWFNSKPYGGLFINPNLSSQLLLFSFPFSIYSIVYSKKSLIKTIQGLTLIFSLISILIIGSKIVIVATICFFIISSLLWLLANQRLAKSKFLIVLIGGIVCACSFFYMNYSSISKIHSFQHRKELWVRTVGAIKENPIIGNGVGRWRITNLYHVPPKRTIASDVQYNSIYSVEGNIFYERPHNDFLWVWSETGLLGLILYLLSFISVIYYGYQNIKNNKGRQQFFYLLITAIVFVYILIAFFSFPKERIEQSLFLMLFFSFLLNGYKGSFKKKPRSKLSAATFYSLLLVSGFSIYWSCERLQADYHMRNVIEAKRNGNWRSVLTEAKEAEREAYVIAGNGTPVSWYKGLAQIELGQTKQAHYSFKQAYKEHPTHVFVINNLATTYALLNQPDSAIRCYERALEINPAYEDARINLSGLYFNMGNLSKAWLTIKKISTRSLHPKYKLFINTILESKYKKILLKVAGESGAEAAAQLLLSTEELVFFQLHIEAIEKGKTIEEIFVARVSEAKVL